VILCFVFTDVIYIMGSVSDF